MFDGWAPKEVHTFYADDQETITGYVVVEREPEWDDAARERALLLQSIEDSMCPDGCGNTAEDAHSAQPFVVHDRHCFATSAMAARRRQLRQEQGEKPKEGWDDGLSFVAVPHKDQQRAEAEAATIEKFTGQWFHDKGLHALDQLR